MRDNSLGLGFVGKVDMNIQPRTPSFIKETSVSSTISVVFFCVQKKTFTFILQDIETNKKRLVTLS